MLVSRFQERPDISPNVIHLIRGTSAEAAFTVLRTVLKEKRLIGGTGMIRGSYRCVCFTEAPYDQLRAGLAWSISKYNPSEARRFQPYGILVGKSYLFALGGRPVIYQSHDEYDDLPELLRYRHVKYEPTATPPVDFTWEREWRLRTEELRLDPERCAVLVQTESEREILIGDHMKRHSDEHQAWSVAIGEQMASLWFPEQRFAWIVMTPQEV